MSLIYPVPGERVRATAAATRNPGFPSASEGYPRGGRGGSSPHTDTAATRNPGFPSASEGYPRGGRGGSSPHTDTGPPHRHSNTGAVTNPHLDGESGYAGL